jgi:hypothetical protein
MPNRAMEVAVALQTEMPEVAVFTAPYTRENNEVDCADSPVIVVSDGTAQGFTITTYGVDGDDIMGLNREVYLRTQKGFHLADPQVPSHLHLMHEKSEPILDESDFQIGERMHFRTLHQSVSAAEAA